MSDHCCNIALFEPLISVKYQGFWVNSSIWALVLSKSSFPSKVVPAHHTNKSHLSNISVESCTFLVVNLVDV